MKIKKITAQEQTGRQRNNSVNRTIQCVLRNCKSSMPKTAIFTRKPYIINGFYTKLLEINRESFRIERRGVRHASGVLFKLDRLNFRAAKQFLNEVAA